MIEISENYWENLIGVLLAFALLALTIERALYQIFDSKLWGLIEKVTGYRGDPYRWVASARETVGRGLRRRSTRTCEASSRRC